MKTVPNIWMLLLRIALLAVFFYIYRWPLEKLRTGQYQNVIIFLLGLSVITMFPAYLLWTLFGVLWVTISEDRSTIRFHYFYKTIEISGTDIDGYYKTVHKTKLSTFQGLLIKLKSNKVIEVTEYNVKSVKEIGLFLNYNKAPLRGNKNSWFPLKRRI